MPDIAQHFCYIAFSPDRFVFVMDIKSLCTVIDVMPYSDALAALQHFLNKQLVLELPTQTLVHLAELVPTLKGLHSFRFKQVV